MLVLNTKADVYKEMFTCTWLRVCCHCMYTAAPLGFPHRCCHASTAFQKQQYHCWVHDFIDCSEVADWTLCVLGVLLQAYYAKKVMLQWLNSVSVVFRLRPVMEMKHGDDEHSFISQAAQGGICNSADWCCSHQVPEAGTIQFPLHSQTTSTRLKSWGYVMCMQVPRDHSLDTTYIC